MIINKPFSKEVLKLENPSFVINEIASKLRNDVFGRLKREGGVIGISGGIDSSVTLAIAVMALGSSKVLGVMLPEKDSNSDSKRLALLLANKFGVETVEENITKALEGFGCYPRRDEAVKRVFPEYNPIDYKMKIGVNQTGLNQNLPPVFSLTIIDKEGNVKSKILPAKEYLQIVAASNFKQRCRMTMLYYHAESRHYAVVGTSNKNELEQGFFVKYGDGGTDMMPIGNLYKTQIYQLAEYLGIPEEIIKRPSTTDTYTAEQSQEEFFFQLPFKDMDILWYGFENNYKPEEVSEITGKPEEVIKLIYNNFSRKRRTTEYLRTPPFSYNLD
jgi:NAD+ synthase